MINYMKVSAIICKLSKDADKLLPTTLLVRNKGDPKTQLVDQLSRRSPSIDILLL